MRRTLDGRLLPMLAWLFLAVAAAQAGDAKAAGPQPASPQLRQACSLLDDAAVSSRMDGLRRKLFTLCGRKAELDTRSPAAPREALQSRAGDAAGAGTGKARPETASATDVQVNDSASDAGAVSHTQSESSIAINRVTGTICSSFNDSYHEVVDGEGYAGFSRSTDGGATFQDGGALGSGSWGDPSLVWREQDGGFYLATLVTDGLGIWRSSDDCATFQRLGNAHDSLGDDRGMMAVDNRLASPHYGRLHIVWTDFGAGGRIHTAYSDDGASWSTPVALSESEAVVQSAWPAVGPSGEIYVAWLRWRSDVIDIEMALSTDGGNAFTSIADPAHGKVNPQDAGATAACFQQALNGSVRYIPAPQAAVGPGGAVHVVYSYDPDGSGVGDVVNVYYRRSTNQGAGWEDEVLLNDDTTTTDQFFPALSVGEDNVVSASWYDRRLDPANLMLDYYARLSRNGGVTWEPSLRVSDVSTPVYLDPSLGICYHGDYDQQARTRDLTLIQWSDDRNVQDGHNDPDIWFEATSGGPFFADGFESGDESAWALQVGG